MDYQIITLLLTVVNTGLLGSFFWQSNSEKQKIKNQMVVDTSGLIDGRIIEIVGSGFVPQRIIVPQFVIAELQFLADQGDSFKRERARYGLDVVRRLQDMRQTEVVIRHGMAKGIKEVDDKLVALAKKTGALLYTTDFNLNQVAQIEGVRVLNVNELAQGLRALHLPGERAEIKITQVGQDHSQGVGYLEDGTMVVVEQAGNRVNQSVPVEFTRMLQTQAGKMMFAVLAQGTRPQQKMQQHSTRVATEQQSQQPQQQAQQPRRVHQQRRRRPLAENKSHIRHQQQEESGHIKL